MQQSECTRIVRHAYVVVPFSTKIQNIIRIAKRDAQKTENTKGQEHTEYRAMQPQQRDSLFDVDIVLPRNMQHRNTS